jgi:hypothetical protein
MKKFSAISLILSLFLCSSCVANKKDYGPWIDTKEQIIKPEPEKEIIKRTVIGEEVNCGDGYWVHVWNGSETRKVTNNYRFNETIVIADGDRNLTTCAKVSGTYSWDGYEVTMTKVNLDYYDVDSKNKNSVYIRGDGKRIKYELRTNATLTITDVWEFREYEEE